MNTNYRKNNNYNNTNSRYIKEIGVNYLKYCIISVPSTTETRAVIKLYFRLQPLSGLVRSGVVVGATVAVLLVAVYVTVVVSSGVLTTTDVNDDGSSIVVEFWGVTTDVVVDVGAGALRPGINEGMTSWEGSEGPKHETWEP